MRKKKKKAKANLFFVNKSFQVSQERVAKYSHQYICIRLWRFKNVILSNYLADELKCIHLGKVNFSDRISQNNKRAVPLAQHRVKHVFLTHSACLMEGRRGTPWRVEVSPECRLKKSPSPHMLLTMENQTWKIMHDRSSSWKRCGASLPTGFSLVQVKWPHVISGRKETPSSYMPSENSAIPITVVLPIFSHTLP